MLRVLDIIEGTTVDGPGLRLSIYFAGCRHHCPGCHNPQSWDMEGGREMSVTELTEIVRDAGINVTFSGGDPIEQWRELTPLAQAIVSMGLTIWCYTGYTMEQLNGRPELKPLLDCIDTIVDGPYIEALRDTSLRFRGSSNQRLIKTHLV